MIKVKESNMNFEDNNENEEIIEEEKAQDKGSLWNAFEFTITYILPITLVAVTFKRLTNIH